MTDGDIRPDYYKTQGGGLDVFDLVEMFGLDFFEGNVVKYVVRWRQKGGLTDLIKARTYLNRAIAKAERERRVDAAERQPGD